MIVTFQGPVCKSNGRLAFYLTDDNPISANVVFMLRSWRGSETDIDPIETRFVVGSPEKSFTIKFWEFEMPSGLGLHQLFRDEDDSRDTARGEIEILDLIVAWQDESAKRYVTVAPSFSV